MKRKPLGEGSGYCTFWHGGKYIKNKRRGGANMKKSLRVLSVLCVCAVLLTIAVSAAGETLKKTVSLAATQNEAISGQAGGHSAFARGRNDSGSAHNIGVALQYSTGSGWSDAQTIRVSPGNTGQTSTWGRITVDYLFRTKLWVPGIQIGNPGCIATGYLYTA